MKERLLEFQLSADELDCLKQLASQNNFIAGLLSSAGVKVDDKFVIAVDRNGAEQMRSYLTELLAKVGFERDYSLTVQGAILEKLIDRFYCS